MSTPSPTPVAIDERALYTALDRCMRANPPVNYALHRDASLIADVWAPAFLAREAAVPIELVPAASLEAFRRWALTS